MRTPRTGSFDCAQDKRVDQGLGVREEEREPPDVKSEGLILVVVGAERERGAVERAELVDFSFHYDGRYAIISLIWYIET